MNTAGMKAAVDQRQAVIEDDARALRQLLRTADEKDEMAEGHRLRCAIEELNEEAHDLAEMRGMIENSERLSERVRNKQA